MFCDLPDVPPGAMGRFLLTQMASVAELEAGLISERTKAALVAAKARGVKDGNPNGARALRGEQVGNKEAVGAIKFRAQEHATNLRSIVDDVRAQGIISIRRSPKSLTSVASAPRGGEWKPMMVVRLLAGQAEGKRITKMRRRCVIDDPAVTAEQLVALAKKHIEDQQCRIVRQRQLLAKYERDDDVARLSGARLVLERMQKQLAQMTVVHVAA